MGSVAQSGPIHQEVDLKASPNRGYEAFLNEKQFAALSGLPATIQPEPGGAFTLIGGRVSSRTIEIVPNERIVQAWRVVGWRAGTYSIVTFRFVPSGSGTRIVFDQVGFPPEEDSNLQGGWPPFYWNPLRNFLDR